MPVIQKLSLAVGMVLCSQAITQAASFNPSAYAEGVYGFIAPSAGQNDSSTKSAQVSLSGSQHVPFYTGTYNMTASAQNISGDLGSSGSIYLTSTAKASSIATLKESSAIGQNSYYSDAFATASNSATALFAGGPFDYYVIWVGTGNGSYSASFDGDSLPGNAGVMHGYGSLASATASVSASARANAEPYVSYSTTLVTTGAQQESTMSLVASIHGVPGTQQVPLVRGVDMATDITASYLFDTEELAWDQLYPVGVSDKGDAALPGSLRIGIDTPMVANVNIDTDHKVSGDGLTVGSTSGPHMGSLTIAAPSESTNSLMAAALPLAGDHSPMAAPSALLQTFILTVGSQSYVVPFGQTFDFTTIDPTGVGSFTVSGAEISSLSTIPLALTYTSTGTVVFSGHALLAPVPEPSTCVLLALGAVSTAVVIRGSRRRST